MIVLFDSFVSSDKATSRGLKMKFESIGTGLYDRSSKTSMFNYFNNIVPISIEYILFGCNEISEELNT